MSLAEIEAELAKLDADELRTLALKSWSAFVKKEGRGQECCEEDPRILAALDDAIQRADTAPGQGHAADAVRRRLTEGTSK